MLDQHAESLSSILSVHGADVVKLIWVQKVLKSLDSKETVIYRLMIRLHGWVAYLGKPSWWPNFPFSRISTRITI